jgi:hypothetical protein
VSDLAGALTRATGLVAAVVSAVALVSGLLFSARETGERRRPAWWLDLHQGLGGIAMAAIAAHVVVTLLRSGSGPSVIGALVPGVASVDRVALGWGILGTYLMAGAVFTTWPRRIRDRRLWRTIHLSSAVGMVLALVHGYQMGTDATRVAFRVGLLAILAPMTYALALRAIDAGVRASGRPRP